ncbi:MAG: heterodisulfide reductase-related iron-sulfur binding cluster [Sulfolobaceae archaeon]
MYILDPSDPSFFNTEKLHKEFLRQATICHGCRLCFNYCDAFPKLFKLTDSKGVQNLSLEDLFSVASECFHCKMCYIKCPYVPPHEFAMDFPHLMEWAWLVYKTKKGISLRDVIFESLDNVRMFRGFARRVLPKAKKVIGIDEEAPDLVPSEKGFLERVKVTKLQSPIAKVVLFHTCLIENFYPEIGEDLIEVYNKLGIEVEVANFKCCGAPMMDVGDAKRLKSNAEYNIKIIEKYIQNGYDVVSPIPTCTLFIGHEYKYILGREVPKVYDSMEYLFKLIRENKIKIDVKIQKLISYHPPCHLRYLNVGLPGVAILRRLGARVEIVDKGCSGIDGGWGLRNYKRAKIIGSKMMEAFKNSNAEVFATECPLAGLQIYKASDKRPLHPIQILREALKNG